MKIHFKKKDCSSFFKHIFINMNFLMHFFLITRVLMREELRGSEIGETYHHMHDGFPRNLMARSHDDRLHVLNSISFRVVGVYIRSIAHHR